MAQDDMPIERGYANAPPKYHKQRMEELKHEERRIANTLADLYAGVSLEELDNGKRKIGIIMHDATYTIDFTIKDVGPDENIVDVIVSDLKNYSEEHCFKIIGCGICANLAKLNGELAPALWKELDVIPFVLEPGVDVDSEEKQRIAEGEWSVDEEADSVVRKALMLFAPTKQPRLYVGFQNDVQPDCKGRIHLTTTEDYKKSAREMTWKASEPYIKDLVDRKVRIVFFNATPQGGGVALMRHALLRYLRPRGVNVEWYVPRPKPDVFRITKTNHNILQGVVGPEVRQTQEDLDKIKDWVKINSDRYWLKKGGPLASRKDGGADIIIVDDPQMPELIPLAKQTDPERPVIFRCHIEVRDDLVQKDGSAAQQVWQNMWQSIKLADLFISHPVRDFVPDDVDPARVGYMPATTDWLDGLNKNMRGFDVDYYLHEFNDAASRQGSPKLIYPRQRYICQIARFDPAKGIPDVISAFSQFRAKLREAGKEDKPQLVICGHSSVDDPDGSKVFDETMKQIQEECKDLKDDIIVARLGPSDQMLNAIISKAEVVLQLSTREGFEVKVSEALHKGKPVVVTQAGGIPLQVHHEKNGFVVPRNSPSDAAKALFALWTDDDLYKRMSDFAMHNVSDEVHTVGNALSWTYLASKMTQKKGSEGSKEFGKDAVRPNMKWINDLAREEAGVPYQEGEPKLWRDLST